MKLEDLRNYETVILYGMGLNGKSMLDKIRSFVTNIICWDREQDDYDGYKVMPPPTDLTCLTDYGKYIIIVTPTVPEYMVEMVNRIPCEYNVATLYSFEDKDEVHTDKEGVVMENGYCPSCESDVGFVKRTMTINLKFYGSNKIFGTVCPFCESTPKERAAVDALNAFFPDWHSKTLHEFAPSISRIESMQTLMERHGKDGKYSYSYFYEDVPFGEYKGESRCENLQRLTFADESIDYFATIDVLDRIHSPLLALAEIGRVLRKGGAHIFTIPNNCAEKTVFRVKEQNGKLLYLEKPKFHGNQINEEGALVTVDWGNDIAKYVWVASGMELLEYVCYKSIGRESFEMGTKVFIGIKR